MAVRKFLDDTGAQELNRLLATKFNTKIDKLDSKTYTDIIGVTDNTDANCAFFFGSVRPIGFYDYWCVKYRVYVWVPANNNYRAMSECLFMGGQSNVAAYSVFNSIYSTSYRPVYYHSMYRLTSTGYNAGYGHALGISLRDSTNRLDTSLKRSVKIELLDQVNCQVTLLNNMVKWANWTGGNTTNYGSITSYNFSANGLQETGDSDTYTVTQNTYEKAKVGAGGIYGYSIVTYDTDDKLQGFVNSYSTGTTKTKNTATFKLGMPFFYYNSTTAKVLNEVPGDGALRMVQPGLNLRYSTNCGTTLTTNLPVYLVGIPNGDTFTLADTWWTQTLPTTEDGKIYILLGIAYSTYQIQWNNCHPVYWYKDGKLKLYSSQVIPTKTSDLTNDSNFIQDSSYVHTDNNFTTTLKNKLDVIASGAQVNVIETIKVNGDELTPDANKAVDISVPNISYGTTDLTPGTSELLSGTCYFVYE